jgi:hypothetical protein
MIIIQNRNFDAVIENRNRWMEPQNHIEGTQEWSFYVSTTLIQTV